MEESSSDVKIPVSEERSYRGPIRRVEQSHRFDSTLDRDKSKSKEFALNYKDELEKTKIISVKLEKSKSQNDRELHLMDQKDFEIYHKISEFIKENPHASLLETVEYFQKFPTSDAIAKVVLEHPHPDYILKFYDDRDIKKQHKRENFERLLLNSGLILEHEIDSILDCTYIKVFAPFERLCEQARIIKLKMRLDSQYLPKIKLERPAKNFLYHLITKHFKYEINLDKGSAFFRRNRLRQFEGAGEKSSIGEIILNFFPSSRRILLVNRMITTANQINIKAPDKEIIVKRTIKSLAIKNLVNDGIFTDVYPLHDGPATEKHVEKLEEKNLRAQLSKLWVRSRRKQPIDKIRLYFGEKLALYFAWLGFYTTWLAIASIMGIIVVVYGLSEYYFFGYKGKQDFSIVWDNALTAPFAFLMAIWSTCFLETWKRSNASIAYDWDVMEFEKEELSRPEFYGTIERISPITLKQEIHFPSNEQRRKFLISAFVVFICMMIVIVSVTILLLAPKLWIHLGKNSSWITASTNLVIIFFMNMMYSYVADWLTSFENHRTETSFESSLIIKSYLFDFVNCYTGLFYILIFKQKFIKNIIHQKGITGCDYDNCMTDLTIQLAIILIGRQMFGQFNETIWPWMRSVVYKNRLQEEFKRVAKRYNQDSRSDAEIPQWALDDKLYSAYGSERSEYGEMIVQFGFISLFGIAFPLAPFFAWANNVIEIRSDAFKYVYSLQRPIGMQAQDMGVWENILGFISFLSVLTNALIIAFHSTWMRNKLMRIYGDDENQILIAKLVFILLFEHLVILVKLVFAYMIPDIPESVQFSIEREQFLAKLALEDEPPVLDEYFHKGSDDSSLFDGEELKLPKKRKTFSAEEDDG